MEALIRRLRALRVLGKQVIGIEPRIRRSVRRRLEFHGARESGWNIVEGSLSPNSAVVDIGLGEDVSFSESIIAKYGCVVCGFDPTPRAIQYVQSLHNDHMRLFECGIGTTSGMVEFFLPNNESHVSGSVRREPHLGPRCIEVRVITIGDVFEMIGSERIDLLKLDIEGAEYELIQSPEFHRYAGAIGQICVEFHHRWKSRGKESTQDAVDTLKGLGFYCAWYSHSTNEEFLFVK